MSLDETIPTGSEFRVIKAGKDLPLPPNEQQRLAALHRYNILDAPAEPDFDNLVTLAAQLAGVPVAMISLMDHDRQWFLAKKGVPMTPREIAFCAHTILNTAPVVVNDLRFDDRFSTNPLVAHDPHIVFSTGSWRPPKKRPTPCNGLRPSSRKQHDPARARSGRYLSQQAHKSLVSRRGYAYGYERTSIFRSVAADEPRTGV